MRKTFFIYLVLAVTLLLSPSGKAFAWHANSVCRDGQWVLTYPNEDWAKGTTATFDFNTGTDVSGITPGSSVTAPSAATSVKVTYTKSNEKNNYSRPYGCQPPATTTTTTEAPPSTTIPDTTSTTTSSIVETVPPSTDATTTSVLLTTSTSSPQTTTPTSSTQLTTTSSVAVGTSPVPTTTVTSSQRFLPATGTGESWPYTLTFAVILASVGCGIVLATRRR